MVVLFGSGGGSGASGGGGPVVVYLVVVVVVVVYLVMVVIVVVIVAVVIPMMLVCLSVCVHISSARCSGVVSMTVVADTDRYILSIDAQKALRQYNLNNRQYYKLIKV